MSLADKILALRCPYDLLSNGQEYRAGFKAGYEECRREAAELAKAEHNDGGRFLDWLLDPNRKSPELAFTSGEVRQVADVVLVMIKQAAAELARASGQPQPATGDGEIGTDSRPWFVKECSSQQYGWYVSDFEGDWNTRERDPNYLRSDGKWYPGKPAWFETREAAESFARGLSEAEWGG